MDIMEKDSYFLDSSIHNAEYFLDSSNNKIFFIDCVYHKTPPSIIEFVLDVDDDVRPYEPSLVLCDIKSAKMNVKPLSKVNANSDKFFKLSKLKKPDPVEFLLKCFN